MDYNLEVEPRRIKRPQEQAFREGDSRIDELPDHIIAHVLSFLQTDEAIKTCILSSRWRYLWKGITRISLCGYRLDPDNFSNLVEHVIHNCSSSRFRAFELYCPDTIAVSRLNAWISCALSRDIEELVLCFNNTLRVELELPVPPLPQCILSCSTLVELQLDYFDIQVPESIVCFPRLKSLDVGVVFPNYDGVNQLLSCCPVLEELSLFGFLDSPQVVKLDISVATLRKLSMSLKNEDHIGRNESSIIINTPNLQYLSIEDKSYAQYIAKHLACLHNVEVNYQGIFDGHLVPDNVKHLLGLLKGIATTESLKLEWSTLDVLRSALSYPWPTFSYMVTLILKLEVLSGWTCFSKVLHSAPNLEVLILDLEGINDTLPDDRSYEWSPPDSIPNCLLEHLEVIGIQWFQGNQDELQVVEYLLNYAQVLERMLIGFYPNPMDEEVVKRLLTFPRASEFCDVQAYEHLCFDTDLPSNMITLWGF